MQTNSESQVQQNTLLVPKKIGVDLSRFYTHSGIRENCFCEKNPKYWMSPLPTKEARERAGL